MTGTILYIMEKLKSFLRDDHLFYGLLIVLVGLGSFVLGRQSVTQNNQGNTNDSKISITSSGKPKVSQTASAVVPASPSPESNVGILVASKSGARYHLDTCPGAKQIKSENMIYFNSIDEAEAAGYTPAANCPGLK